MGSRLELKLDRICDACRNTGVSRLYAFGSVLRGDYVPGRSDIDLLVEFSHSDPYEKKNAYFRLFDELCAILETEKIDLVMTGAVKNPYLAQSIDASKQIIYAI